MRIATSVNEYQSSEDGKSSSLLYLSTFIIIWYKIVIYLK